MDLLSPLVAPAQRLDGGGYSLSVVVPVFNEEAVLPEFHRRLGAVLESLPASAEIVYVNDGSRDGTSAMSMSPRIIAAHALRWVG